MCLVPGFKREDCPRGTQLQFSGLVLTYVLGPKLDTLSPVQ